MTRAFLIVGALAIMPVSAIAQPQSPPAAAVDPQRLAAARELVDLTDVEATLDRMFIGLAPVFADGAIGAMQSDPNAKAALAILIEQGKGGQAKLVAVLSEEFLKAIRKQYPAVKDRAAREYAAAFTIQELRQLVAFYRTGAGAKWLQLAPILQEKLSEFGGEIGRIAGEEAGRNGIERAIREMLPEPKTPST